MTEWMRVTAIIVVPLAVVLAVMLLEVLRVMVSRRERAEMRRRFQELGVATTVAELLKAGEREAVVDTTTGSGASIIHFLNTSESQWVTSATTHTTTAGRQPLNATKYVGAVPAFAKSEARQPVSEPKAQAV